jgi:hypothetical protein
MRRSDWRSVVRGRLVFRRYDGGVVGELIRGHWAGARRARDPQLLATLELSQPVALMLLSILQFVADSDDPYGIVARLVDAVPSGSYLTITHPTYDVLPPETVAGLDRANAASLLQPRSRAEFTRFFDGLELVSPGVELVSDWRAGDEPQPRPTAADSALYGAIARIP